MLIADIRRTARFVCHEHYHTNQRVYILEPLDGYPDIVRIELMDHTHVDGSPYRFTVYAKELFSVDPRHGYSGRIVPCA